MSEYGEGDYCDVWQERVHTARKEHMCAACHETIRPGDTYHRTFSVFDGNPDTVIRCARCQTIFEHLSTRIQDEGERGEEYCNPTLNCGHEYTERWNEEPPPEIAALAFALPGEVKLQRKPNETPV